MSTQQTNLSIPTGTWEIDPAHSSANFSARHLMVSKVRGSFKSFHGTITIAEDPLQSTSEVEIDAASIDTRDEQRDGHLKSPDFLDVEKFPTIVFTSTSVKPRGGDEYDFTGDLVIHGVTRPVELDLTFTGLQKDPWGGTRIGFEANTEISRKEFGLEWNVALEAGGVMVGDKVKIELEIEAVHKEAAAG